MRFRLRLLATTPAGCASRAARPPATRSSSRARSRTTTTTTTAGAAAAGEPVRILHSRARPAQRAVRVERRALVRRDRRRTEQHGRDRRALSVPQRARERGVERARRLGDVRARLPVRPERAQSVQRLDWSAIQPGHPEPGVGHPAPGRVQQQARRGGQHPVPGRERPLPPRQSVRAAAHRDRHAGARGDCPVGLTFYCTNSRRNLVRWVRLGGPPHPMLKQTQLMRTNPDTRPLHYTRAAVVAIALLSAAGNVGAAHGESLESPDRKLRLRLVRLAEASLGFEVVYKDRPVIEPSRLGIAVDGVNIGEGVEVGNAESYRIDETYRTRGGHTEAANRCNGAKIGFTHVKSGTKLTLDLRAFNDGIAYRFIVPGSDKPRVPEETSSFTLPPGSTVWYHDLEGHYEAAYDKKAVSDVPAGQWVAPPLTVQLPDGLGYASITESALANYSGMALRADGRRGFAVVLGHAHHVSYPFRLRYAADVERLSKPATVTGTITTPWRVVMVAADLNALVNSDIVENRAPAPDAKLFPKGLDTDWIKPGRAVWKYLDGGQSTLDGVKEFSRLAGELGFEYQVVEGFWSRWTDEQIKEAVDYSRKQNVGLWFWRHSKQLRSAEEREAFFKKLHDFGVVGAKIDFFDHEHREVVDHYQALLRDAAKYRIMVNFHGANKPTGEPRTWPNELIREGVRGMEASKLLARAKHNTTLPFTRYPAGHADYTPVHFGARRGDTTWTQDR